MIKVIRLSGDVLYINYFLIEGIETIPETKIRMVNGNYYLVKDTVESIIQQVNAFLHSCFALENRMNGESSAV